MEKYSEKCVRRLDKKLLDLREKYKQNGIPSALISTLNELTIAVMMKDPVSILEIGTATGISGIAMLQCSSAFLTTIEKDEESYVEAEKNFREFGLCGRVKQYLADAAEILNYADGEYDFIFLDGAKSHYIDYLYDIKRLLKNGGVLFADNVLFRGYVDGGVPYGRGDYTIVNNMRKFLDKILSDEDFVCTVRETGDGNLVAIKR